MYLFHLYKLNLCSHATVYMSIYNTLVTSHYHYKEICHTAPIRSPDEWYNTRGRCDFQEPDFGSSLTQHQWIDPETYRPQYNYVGVETASPNVDRRDRIS